MTKYYVLNLKSLCKTLKTKNYLHTMVDNIRYLQLLEHSHVLDNYWNVGNVNKFGKFQLGMRVKQIRRVFIKKSVSLLHTYV